MADNVELNAGTGGATLATDDVTGVHFQKVKIDVGGDGASAALSNSNPLPVSDAGGSLTVDNGGTFAVQAAQSGTWNVTNVSGTVSLPTGAATAAKQPALGTAGTASADVITVQGVASMTALQVADNGGSLTVDGTVAATQSGNWSVRLTDGTDTADVLDLTNSNPLTVAIVDGSGDQITSFGGGTQYTEDAAAAANPVGNALIVVRDDARGGSLTTADGDNVALRGTNAGELYVKHVDSVAVTNAGLTELASAIDTEVQCDIVGALPAGTNNIGDVDVLSVPADPFGANADAASATGSISAKLRFIASTGIPVTGTVTVGSHAVTNAGTFAVQVDGNALTALQLIDNACIADDAAFTPATTGVHMAGFFADETATDSVDEGDGGAARMTLDRKQIVTPYVHAGAGGHTPYYNLDVDETEDAIKATAGKLFWIHAMNLSTGVRYIKFYNATTANVTVGTTTPVLSFPIPTMADTNGAGFCIHFGDAGVQFDTAITVAAVTGLADNSTGAPGANEIVLNAGYL